jgi:hypothetical protein
VTIDAPSLARNRLVYDSTLICETGSVRFVAPFPLKALTLHLPTCPDGNSVDRLVKWTYAVGAPGYAVFSGSIHR